MAISILFFGQLTDVTGCSQLKIAHVRDTDQLKDSLVERYPLLAHTKYVIAIDKKIIRTNVMLPQEVEVALLPPFSGG
ncbi:MoaD/ThiS family protein [Olivibacter sp. CPCC 100613]|uniref:MoaD/ThiS family protein n=1 Tax=Olivibacter sp. CPCC 100613 TaxID=3079931 RepID=UPI002FFAF530